jgi:arylsulfatase A
VRSGPWKLHLAKGDLYNLQTDIGESESVAAKHPEVVKRLRAVAKSTTGDLGLDGVGPGCRPLGRVENPQPIIAPDGAVRPEFRGPARLE